MARDRTACALVCLALALAAEPARAEKNKDVENIGTRDINRGSWNLWSMEKEIALGRELAQQVEVSSRLLRDPYVEAQVDSLVQDLVRHSDAKVPFTVRVIDGEEVNAFALPGGFLYVNTGLILEAETEAELAGILAHEIAHVTARHATKQASKATILQWATLPLLFVGGPVGVALQQGLGLAIPLTFLKFSRNAERESDFLGLQYTYLAGYDPVALIDILERISGQEKESRLGKLFSSHPMSKDRIRRAQETIAQVLPPRSEHVISSSHFEELKTYLRARLQAESIYRHPQDQGPLLRRRTEVHDKEKGER